MNSSRPFFGWYVVAAAFGIATFGWGFGFYGLAVYIAELQARPGWSVAFIGSVITAYYLFGALLLGLYDGAVARYGQRSVTALGVLAMAAGAIGVAHAQTTWQLVTAFLVLSLGWSSMSLAAVTAMVSPWFDRRRGLALSLALNGASFGGIALAPALLWLSQIWGFQIAMTVAAAIMLSILLPTTLMLIGRSPEDAGLLPDGDAEPDGQASGRSPEPSRSRRSILTTVDFWLVAFPFALGLLAQVGFITHQVAFLTSHLGAGGAATALALTTSAAVAGRIALGLVVDRWNPRLATAGCLLSQALALVLMTAWPTPMLLYAACVVFGLSVGNLITLPALVAQREFPPGDLVVIVGMIAAISQIFYAFGPGVLGVVREVTGDYVLPLILCAGLEAAAAALLCLKR